MFYCGGSFEYGEHSKADYDGETHEEQVRSKARALALLSLGSALHVIQDSYSTSHVIRNRNNSGAIINFFQYSDDKNIPDLKEVDPQYPKHCQHDSYVEHNKKQIELAELKSKEFLMQVNPSKTNGFSGKSCYDEMIGWLRDGIFKLVSEETSVIPNNVYQLDTCKPVSPSSTLKIE